MAQRRKRAYGSGSLYRRGKGWVIRWREREIGPDGTVRRVLRYEALGAIPKQQASTILAERLAASGSETPGRSRVTFGRIVADWITTVLPMYRYSTQHNHRHILKKHLVPRFGSHELCDLSRADVQAYVAELTHAGYAPKTVDHIHDVLSAVLRTAMTWGHLRENPAHGVKLPELRTVRPKPVLTLEQARRLLARLDTQSRTMVGVALLTGVRRGELFGVRWRDVDLLKRVVTVEQAVYEGHFGPPKTRAGERCLPLSDAACALLVTWRQEARQTGADDLVFATRTGKPISPNNVLRRAVFPAVQRSGCHTRRG